MTVQKGRGQRFQSDFKQKDERDRSGKHDVSSFLQHEQFRQDRGTCKNAKLPQTMRSLNI
eukprot:2455877-Amphidinium_carterae.1